MLENNKSYRIRTDINNDNYVTVNLSQDYDSFDILSLKINSLDAYKHHNSKYGVVVGRVLANGGFGVPNAKISVFVESENPNMNELDEIYPFTSTVSRDNDNIRYNLLPDNKVSDCHQVVGTFPNKRFMLDNNILVEMYDKYYKYTTRTNEAGDYMLACVPVGQQVLHMDLDLSDCGILSQRPRDFIYKGYNVEQFENPNQFRSGTEFETLSQIFSQDQIVYVQPFWGNESEGETIGITRADINISYKFEPTCVFIGCVVSDNSSQGISKNCVPTEHMGDMDELVAGKGRIEMIRKTYGGSVEEFQINGTELINGEGIWCYQIPMNLDYMVTDEYGRMVPTDNPSKGIPTRTRVRFRMSMEDMEENVDNFFRAKVLVPHNPQNLGGTKHEDYDYEFGTHTKDESFRDLFWNNVYTVKSYIPRFQKRKVTGWKAPKFTGIKHCQDYGSNNPIPYNNIRIKLPFMFRIMCILIKVFIKLVAIYNRVVALIGNVLVGLAEAFSKLALYKPAGKVMEVAQKLHLNIIEDGLCPDLENWYFAPLVTKNGIKYKGFARVKTEENSTPHKEYYDLVSQTMDVIENAGDYDDETSIDTQNTDPDDNDDAICITFKTDYLISCVEMNLAQEYKVINFDFYNDWVNGMIYFPRWMRYIRLKRRFRGNTIIKSKTKACMDNTKIFSKARRYTQLCSLAYEKDTSSNKVTYSKVTTKLNNKTDIRKSNNYHKKRGFSQVKIFGKNGGICHEKETMAGQHVYYLKPCEWLRNTTPANKKVNLFATDLVLLGSLNECDMYGVPQAFRYLSSTSYIMPTNLALTNMETDGVLYSYGDNKTICSKTNQSSLNGDDPNLDKPVGLADNTLVGELNYFSGAGGNYDTQYEDDESDTIPMTEAAGISWNYTGPGQNEINEYQMYYPGGHFLGLSCSNSQTNIKSCINLERICEQGVVMSQRKVDVRAVSTGGTSELKYVYTAPSGFIAKDEIVDDYFRSMFATMNKNRLIATKMNRETGYFTYDFDYVNPMNFSGEFSNFARPQTSYNSGVSIVDESSVLSSYGIASGTSRPDFDADESTHTQVRTIEDKSVDYYMFRLGLDYEDLKSNNQKHKRQFAAENKNKMYLPQYENSYYFYFGLHAGSTAIDEFNKQFFSQCENSVLIEREPNINLVIGDFKLCSGTSTVSIVVENMEEPFEFIVYDDNGNVFESENGDNINAVFELPSGEYQILVRDTNGVEMIRNIVIGDQILQGSFVLMDFNNNITNDFGGSIQRTQSNKNIFYGGGIACNNVFIDDSIETYTLVAVKDGLNPITDFEVSEVLTATGESEETQIIYLSSANTEYDFYVKYQVEGCSEQYLFVVEGKLMDTSVVNLQYGAVEKSNVVTDTMYTKDWWVGRYTEPVDITIMESKQRWNARKAMENTTCNSATTDSCGVSTNGDKFVFGSPQNFDSVLYNNKYYVDGYNTPAGMSVDDDYSYYPTYGIPQYNNVKQFNCVSYMGSVVFGSFAAIVSGQYGETKQLVLQPQISNRLRHGDGCVLKSLPDGVLYPAIAFNQNNNWTIQYIDATQSQNSGWNDVEYGIVYPTICYPSLNKVFRTDVCYTIINRIMFNNTKESYEPFNYLTKCDGSIFNGVTYNRKYSGKSHIDLYENTNDLEDSTDITIPALSDFAGVYSATSIPLVTYVSGFTAYAYDENMELNEVGTNYSYSITEGYPLYKHTANQETTYSAIKTDNYSTQYEKSYLYESVVDTLGLDMNASFYDNICYNSGSTITFGGLGVSDSDVKYYCLSKDQTNLFNEYSTVLFYKSDNSRRPDTIVVPVVYNVAGTEFNVGDIGVITFKKATGHYSVEYFDADGNVVEIDDIPGTDDRGRIDYMDIVNMATWVIENTDPSNLFKSAKMYRLFTNSNVDYRTNILDLCNSGNRIINGHVTNLPSGEFFIVGIKSFSNDDGRATGRIGIVYVTPVDVNNVDNVLN